MKKFFIIRLLATVFRVGFVVNNNKKSFLLNENYL